MNLDFLTIDVGTILFTLINTLLIFLAFKLILFKRVDAILAARQQEVSTTYSKADDALAAANSDKEKYAQAIAGAKDEAAQILTRAEKKAQLEGDLIISEAKTIAADVREKAAIATEREKVQARAELQGEISELAMELAQKIMEKEIDKADHARLIEDFMQEKSWARNANGLYGYNVTLKQNVDQKFVKEESYIKKCGWCWATSMNRVVLRLADVKLMRAEAFAQLGQDGEAISLVNEIRRRAAASTGMMDGYPRKYGVRFKCSEYTDNSNALAKVKFERRLELAMEAERFFCIIHNNTPPFETFIIF